ncbi:sulfite exporter TauE/SafE family protein [Bacteriovoracaceae bacterium]|nr:sulfite exporter TauE/SafE family protein [Bacteriovoracaceae bacterium]
MTSQLSSIIISSLAFGLLSSLHCLSMCGPLACAAGKSAKNQILYEGGRLLSYLILGFVLAKTSTLFFKNINVEIHQYSLIFLIVLYFYIGLMYILKKRNHFASSKIFSGIYQKFYHSKFITNKRHSQLFPFFLGLISALLPCGLLHTYLLGVIPLKHDYLIFAYISMFWLATALPLTSLGFTFQKIKEKVKSPRIIGISYIVLGIYLIVIRTLPIFNPESCH